MKFPRLIVVGFLIVALLALSVAGCDFLPSFSFEFPTPPSGPGPVTPVPTTTPSGQAPTITSPIDPGWTPKPAGQGAFLPSFVEVAKAAAPAVVSIQTEGLGYDIFLQPVPEEGAGSGVIIDERGYIVTNNHVVEGASSVKVTLADGRTFDAVKVNRDPQTDLAVVQIQATNLPVAKIGRSDKLQVGDWLVAIGNALALEGGPTVTSGIVSYLGRQIQEPNGVTLYNLIQTDAAINPGNSGGALLNMAGEVVGINTAIVGDAQNIGFSIAITPAMTAIQQLIQVGKVVRAYLGVTFITVNAAAVTQYKLTVKEGVMLTMVAAGTPAEKAGLKAQDVITSLDGKKVTTAEGLRGVIQSKKPGDTVDIAFTRGSDQMTTKVTLGENPNPQ